MKMFGCGIRDDDGVFLTCIYICEKEMCGSESGSSEGCISESCD